MSISRKIGTGIAVVAWAALIGIGFWRVFAYEAAAGASAAVPGHGSQWPHDSDLPRDPTRPVLILVAHPQCPCTRASLTELSRLLAHASSNPNPPQAFVLFATPEGTPRGWEKTDLWRAASAISGVQVITDKDGVESARFGAATSGQCFLFSPEGRRLFAGGITEGRGHEGDNAGEDILNRLLAGRPVPDGLPQTTPVYGCALGATAVSAADRFSSPSPGVRKLSR